MPLLLPPRRIVHSIADIVNSPQGSLPWNRPKSFTFQSNSFGTNSPTSGGGTSLKDKNASWAVINTIGSRKEGNSMTNRFASRVGSAAAAAILACTLAVSADAKIARPATAAPENVVLFFDVQ